MGLLDTATKGWGGGLLIGIGAAVAAPVIFPAAGAAVRPIAKGLVWGCLAAAGCRHSSSRASPSGGATSRPARRPHV